VSGWIKLEKGLREDRRVMRMVDALLARQTASVTSVTQMRFMERSAVTQVLGGLAQLWMFADSHIREDDTLDITPDEVDQLVGIEGFTNLMPPDWLEVVEQDRIRLPGFQAHNGTDAKKKALTAKRVRRHRIRTAVSDVAHAKRTSVTDALPDQTRPDQTRPDQTRPDQKLASLAARARETAASTENFAKLKAAYPAGTYRESEWLVAEREVEHRITEGHNWPDLHAGVERYTRQCEAKGSIGTQFVLSPSKFFRGGPAPPFLEPFPLPATKADTRLAGNLSAAEEFMRRTESTQ
jgi:hypothetical protein